MATRESPDVFTLRITGIQPDQDVLIQTFFVQLAEPDDEGWTLRVPLTVAPIICATMAAFSRARERYAISQGIRRVTVLFVMVVHLCFYQRILLVFPQA